jgi:hypothetical protein
MPYVVTATDRGRKRDIEFPTIEEAISFGQNHQMFYDIFDTLTSRTIDWTEINENFDDPWYYDEKELVWKKYKED